ALASVRRSLKIQSLKNTPTRLTVQNTRANAGRQLLQALEQIPNLVLLDVAEIRHEVGDVASRVGHLLVDVVVEQDAVDCV
nr:hypothetical protein [Tanacetum cinerariifolium]